MENRALTDFLSRIHPVEQAVLETYAAHWSTYSVPRKTVLTRQGETERYIYFVQEGIQKSYYLNEGKQHILFFAYAPSFSGIMESFFTQTPSRYFLETISDSHFLRLPYFKHEELIEQHRPLETLFRKITEQFLLGIIERHHQLMAFDVKTRFKSFFDRSPHLLNMVSQKDLASYLRIDPTNFSKLLNNEQI